jgi:NAD(P)H-dependent flavin oxidoreductase YrpB (nitropropane dioxygenase family)
MSRVAGPELAAAVANAGGLGMLGVGRMPRAGVATMLDQLGESSDGPAGATFIVPHLDREVLADVAARLTVIEFFYGWPEQELAEVAPVVGWQVGSVEEAEAAVAAGCAYVIAQGVEAGGHVRGTTPVLELLDLVRSAVSVPVVVAGGIGDAASLRSALDAGADAVRLGTRFVAAAESDAHPAYVEEVVAARPEDTVLTEAFYVGWPDAPHRVLAGCLARAEATTADIVATMEVPGRGPVALPRFAATPPNRATTGDVRAMALYAGCSVGAVTGVQPAAEIVAELTAGLH